MSSAFSIDFIEPTSEFQTPVTFLLEDKNTFIYFLSKLARKVLELICQVFAEICTFSTPAPMVSVLANIARYATSSLILRNVRACMAPISAKYCLKLYIIKKAQIFGMNMPLISSP